VVRAAPIALAVSGLMASAALGAGEPAYAVSPARHSMAKPVAQPVGWQAAAGSMTGVVLGAGRTGLVGACVIASGPAGVVVTMTAGGGRYAIGGLPAGRYVIRYEYCRKPGAYVARWYGGSYLRSEAASVIVGPGRPTLLRPVSLLPVSPGPASPMSIARATEAMMRREAERDRLAGRHQRPELSGVVRSASGKGVGGICVWVISGTPSNGGGIAEGSARDGHYSYPAGAFSAGKYRVAFDDGCGSHANYAPQWWKHATTFAKATVLRLGRGRSVTHIDARLTAGGVVAGTISGGSRHGPKLRGICVQAQPASPADQIPFELIQATSDRGGRYRVAGLATGKFQFSFYPGCGGGSGYIGLAYPSAVLVTAGRTTRVNPTLPPQSTISGTATGPGGRPVAGICVFAVGRESFGKATTSRRGRYAIGGLSAGQYEVDFAGGCGSSGSYAPTAYGGSRRPASVPVGRGEHVTGINAAMRPGATITGKVTDRSRRPIETCLQTTARSTYVGDGLTPQGLNPDSFVYDTAAGGSSADGSYRIANLLPGVYNIAFNNCNGGGAPYAGEWFHPVGPSVGEGPGWVDALAGRPVKANVTLPAGGSISGVIRSAAGKPLGGICSYPVGVEGQVPFDDYLLTLGAPPTESDRRGDYTISGLAAGQWVVEFYPCGEQSYANSWYRHAASQGAATRVTVTSGRTTSGIDPVLSVGDDVSGRVTSAVTGRPVANECAEALDPQGNAANLGSTGSQGRYQVTNLLPGRYDLAFFSCGGGAGLATELRPIQVTSVRSARLSLALPRSGAIKGAVRGIGQGQDVTGACVEAMPITGSGLPGLATTGYSGRYFVSGLAPGRYDVLFTPNCLGGGAAFAPQWFDGTASRSRAVAVRVTSGTVTSEVNAGVSGDGGISGAVSVSGRPAAGVCAIASPVTGTGVPVLAETGQDGGYQVDGLPPGRYTVEFTSGCGDGSYRAQWYNGGRSQAKATPVLVRSGVVTPLIDAR
jgi:hypothetical protein